MSSFLAVMIVAVGIFWMEGPGLLRRKLHREFVIFIIFLLTATILYGALTLKVHLPNPFNLIKMLFNWWE
jgi:type IV secretory pathway VirB2 component (pilin)